MLVAFLFVGCGFTMNDFRDKVESFAKDKNIDENEYKELLRLISDSDNDQFNVFKNSGGEIDGSKLRDYIVKLTNKKNLGLERKSIWDPEVQKQATSFNINVFIENSGSMNGYLNDPSTQFKNTVYSLLTRLKLIADNDSLNLYFVNKKEQPQYVNATVDDLAKFKDKLNPAAFQQISAGNTGESDLYEFMYRCLAKSDQRNLSVLVTDGIYSPGKSHPDAAQKLGEMKQGLFLKFSTAMKTKDVSAMVLQFYGNFNGKYYDHLNNVVSITSTMQRPYYIWFIGTSDQINAILNSGKLNELDGTIQNSVIFQKTGKQSTPPYKLLLKPTHGEFSGDDISKYTLSEARASRDPKDKGMFGFEVAVDFSGNLQALEYFDDVNNYKPSNAAYTIEVERIANTEGKASLEGKTHMLRLSTKQMTDETLRIDVIGRLPAWVARSSSSDDTELLSDGTEELKTYGLEYLVKGVADAFYPASQPNTLHTLSITIKK